MKSKKDLKEKKKEVSIKNCLKNQFDFKEMDDENKNKIISFAKELVNIIESSIEESMSMDNLSKMVNSSTFNYGEWILDSNTILHYVTRELAICNAMHHKIKNSEIYKANKKVGFKIDDSSNIGLNNTFAICELSDSIIEYSYSKISKREDIKEEGLSEYLTRKSLVIDQKLEIMKFIEGTVNGQKIGKHNYHLMEDISKLLKENMEYGE